LLPTHGPHQSEDFQLLLQPNPLHKLLESREQIWSHLRNDQPRLCLFEEAKNRFTTT
jgi:hypothetical protein